MQVGGITIFSKLPIIIIIIIIITMFILFNLPSNYSRIRDISADV